MSQHGGFVPREWKVAKGLLSTNKAIKSTKGKTREKTRVDWGKSEVTLAFSLSRLPSFVFPRQFFFRALLSKCLEKAAFQPVNLLIWYLMFVPSACAVAPSPHSSREVSVY